MKIVASVSIEIEVDDLELLDEAQNRAMDKLVDTLDDWINENGIPPIIKIEYKLPSIEDDENNLFLN